MAKVTVEHMNLQFKRLERHRDTALRERDAIAYLDLAHILRIWVDMKREVDHRLDEAGIVLALENTVKDSRIKAGLDGSRFLIVPLSSGVDSPGVKVSGIRVTGRALTDEEIRQSYLRGIPRGQPTKLTLTDWLGSQIIEENATGGNDVIRVSREMLIKRVANLLGASHPEGNGSEDDPGENQFDVPVRRLHAIVVARYPLTYYQLLEIAGQILESDIRKLVRA